MLWARLTWIASWMRSKLRRLRTHKGTRQKVRRRLVATLLLLLTVGGAAAAYAADAAPGGNTLVDPFGLKDSAGIPVGAFGLNFETEGMLESATMGPAIFFAQAAWGLYISQISAVLWGLRWAQGLQLLDALDPVASVLFGVLASTITRLTLVAVALALGVLGAVMTIYRGRTARGMIEIFLAMLIATAAWQNVGGILLADVTIPGGVIWQARDMGSQIGAEIATGGSHAASGNTALSPMDEVDKINQGMVDALVRTPHQLLQYGAVLDVAQDGGKCKTAYDTAMKTVQGTQSLDTTKAVTACDPKLAAQVKDPMSSLLGMPVVLLGGTISLLPLLVLLCAFVFGLCWGLWESVKFAWALLCAILPGAGRVQLVTSLMSIGYAVGLIVLSLAGTGLVALVVSKLLSTGTKTLGIVQTFFVLFLVMAVATVFLIIHLARARKSARKAADRVAKAVAPEAKSMSNSAPKIGLGTFVKPAAGLWAANRVSGGRLAQAMPGGEAGGGSKARRGIVPTAGRIAKSTGKVTVGGVGLALKGTVGAPVYLPRAVGSAKKAATNAKAQVRTKLANTTSSVRQRGADSTARARAFGAEYAGNVRTGTDWVKNRATPTPKPTLQDQLHPTSPGAAAPKTRTDAPPTRAAGQASQSTSTRATTRPAQRASKAVPTAGVPGSSQPSAITTSTPKRAPKKASLNEQHAASLGHARPASPAAGRPSPVKIGKR